MACKIADNSKPFTLGDIERVKENISANMDTVCTGCGYCMGDTCPENIPVANYMQFYNDKLIASKTEKELVEEVDFQHNWGLLVDRKASAADCVQCGKCQEACTQHLNIIERLEEVAGWEKKHAAKK